MTEFKITFNTENAAFDDDLQDGSEDNSTAEVARILASVRSEVFSGRTQGIVRDCNGNTVGQWGWE